MSTAPTPQHAVRQWVNWRTAVLTGTCVAGGLMLNMMVLAVTPDRPAGSAQSAEALPVASSALPPTEAAVAVEAVLTEPMPEAVAVVDDTLAPVEVAPVDAVAPPAPLNVAPAIPAAPVAAVPASAAAEVQQRPQAAASPVAPVSPVTAAPTTVAPKNATPATVAPQPAASTTVPPTPAAPKPVVTTTMVSTTVAPTTAVATTAVAQVISYPSYTTKAGVIYLTLLDNKAISVYSIITGDGWVYEISKDGPRSIEVKFFNVKTERDAEFHADLEDGRIKVES